MPGAPRHGGKNIAGIFNYGARIQVVTTPVHGRATGDSVEIAGTLTMDGVYHNIDVVDSNTFYVNKLPETEAEIQENAGAVYWLEDSWRNMTVWDRTNWLLMVPGENQFLFDYTTNSGLTQIQAYMLRFSYYDHYA